MPPAEQKFQFDPAKFKELVLYICSKAEPERLGSVKLHKTLYYSDMLHYVDAGHPITGAIYRKRQLGPTADALLRTLRELERDGALQIDEVPYFGFRKREFRAKRGADLQRFSTEEIRFVDDVLKFVCDGTAKEISELSHNLAWESTKWGDTIPYESAFLMLNAQVPDEAWSALELEASTLEAERQRDNALDYPTLASWRESVESRS
jgi:hypothetical protein